MKRRDFLQKSSAAGLLMSVMPVFDLSADNPVFSSTNSLSEASKAKLKEVLRWMKTAQWDAFFKEELGLDIDFSGNELDQLTKVIPNIEAKLSYNNPSNERNRGFEDFAGNKLIEPGRPAMSLLYHVLASPRVKSEKVSEYPPLMHIDALEDYIYDYVDVSNLPAKRKSNLYLAVLAYEYRPAFKVPPYKPKNRDKLECAQLVFSRCGIARTGSYEANYDQKNRCFTNMPTISTGTSPDQTEKLKKGIAETPARYGLFLVELNHLGKSAEKLLNQNKGERRNLRRRKFISPIKKITASADLSIEFGEYHLNDKLKRLADYQYKSQSIKLNQPNYDLNRSPFTRISAKNDQGQEIGRLHQTDFELIKLERLNATADVNQQGSSVLLHSVKAPLVREATSNGSRIAFEVPKKWGKKDKEVKKRHANRRYAALKLPNPEGNEVTNFIISHGLSYKSRTLTGFKSPKIAPLFANIKYQVVDNEMKHIDGISHPGKQFDQFINKGGYDAQLFEDSICDGSVSAKVEVTASEKGKFDWLPTEVLPAFSIVTAPDFFPFVDSNEIRSAYFRQNDHLNVDEDFLEGGTLNLSRIRQPGNPYLLDPFSKKPAFENNWKSDESYDTVTAIVSRKDEQLQEENNDFVYGFKKDFKTTSYLPDTATGVFYPGWDITYAAKDTNIYFSPFALGSPFAEDMKLCAAGNGMWPVTSPDAARTYHASLESFVNYKGLRKVFLPATTIPLLDDEIGIHKKAPHVAFNGQKPSFGWDGEQGPYLEMRQDKPFVNYTDIERADYLENFRQVDIGFDMSKLRELESSELVMRMDTQRLCIKAIDHKKVWKTGLWLVAAEKVDWGSSTKIHCLPQHELFSSINAKQPQNPAITGPGYLYVFVDSIREKGAETGVLDKEDEDQKRRIVGCNEIYVCQVTSEGLSYVKLPIGSNPTKSSVDWKYKKARDLMS